MRPGIPVEIPIALHFSVCCVLFLVCANAAGQSADADALQAETKARAQQKEWSGDSYRRSIALYEKAAGLWFGSGDPGRAVNCLREASSLHMILSEYAKAEGLLDTAIRITDKNDLPDEKIQLLSLRSIVLARAGRVNDSKKDYQLAVRMSGLSTDPLSIASAHYSAGEHAYSYGDARETLRFLMKALSSAKETQKNELLAQIRLYLGFTLVKMGDPPGALEETRTALSFWQELDDKRGSALAALGVGFVLSMIGRTQDALDFYTMAKDAFPEDIDWMEKAKSCNGIATIYEDLGEFGLAEDLRIEAIDLYKRANYPYGELATLPSLAKLRVQNGDIATASVYYNNGLELAAKLGDMFHHAVIKEGIGDLEFESGRYDISIRSYQDALRTYNNLNTKLPRVYGSIGRVYEKWGDLDRARHYYSTAHKLNRDIRDRFAEAGSLHDLARIDYKKEDYQSALELISNSIDISESAYTEVSNSRLRRSYFSGVHRRYELMIELLMDKGRRLGEKNYELLALQASEKARARSMLEMLRLSGSLTIKGSRSDALDREREVLAVLNIKSNMLTDALSRGDDKATIENLDKEIRGLQLELEETRTRLKRESPVHAVLQESAPFDLSEFQKIILDDETIALSYLFGETKSFLWLITRNGIESYILPPRSQIEARIRHLKTLMTSRDLLEGETAEQYRARMGETAQIYWEDATTLSKDILGEIDSRMIGKRLLIVPDGEIYYFPISALPHPNTEIKEPILRTNEVIYEPSLSIILLIRMTKVSSSTKPSQDLLIFSDPVFSKSDSRLSDIGSDNSVEVRAASNRFRFVESLTSLPRLMASRSEAETITEIVGSSRTTSRTGFEASREQVLTSEISDYKIIHFATHGLVNDNHPEVSGLIFSRFNKAGVPQDEFIRLADIYGLGLSADLVVLSACGTGVGKEVKGQGLLSLTNGFLQAGARSVVSTLWKVDDAATNELMREFYTAMVSRKATPSEALRAAQIKMSENKIYGSPFYWAAFTVSGEFRHSPDLSKNNAYQLYFLIGLLIGICLAAYGLYRSRQKMRSRITAVT